MGFLNPKEALEGGGVPEGHVTGIKHTFKKAEYKDKSITPSTTLVVIGKRADGSDFEQWLSAGQADFKGTRLTTGINRNTPAMMYLTSLVDAGFPEAQLGDDVSTLDGIEFDATGAAYKLPNGDIKTVMVARAGSLKLAGGKTQGKTANGILSAEATAAGVAVIKNALGKQSPIQNSDLIATCAQNTQGLSKEQVDSLNQKVYGFWANSGNVTMFLASNAVGNWVFQGTQISKL